MVGMMACWGPAGYFIFNPQTGDEACMTRTVKHVEKDSHGFHSGVKQTVFWVSNAFAFYLIKTKQEKRLVSYLIYAFQSTHITHFKEQSSILWKYTFKQFQIYQERWLSCNLKFYFLYLFMSHLMNFRESSNCWQSEGTFQCKQMIPLIEWAHGPSAS